MPRYADITLPPHGNAPYGGAASNFLVQTPAGVWYCIYIDVNSDVSFVKSVDGGFTWNNPTVVFAGTATSLAVFYDRWAGLSADLIHCFYTESGGSDTLYRTINAGSADALSTQSTIHAGTSQANGRFLTGCRSRGGNVYCRTQIDAGAEGAFYRLPNANVPNGAWGAARTINEANATLDQMILMPGFAADNNDLIGTFYDNSATELSRQLHDDSANSWAETSIDTDCTFPAATTSYPHFAVAPDLANNRLVLIMWNAVDTANADLRCWTITEGAINALTPVVANGTDDQAFAALSIDNNTGWWYAFYAGKSDGSEVYQTALNVYMKVSQDAGSTWGPETQLSSEARGLGTIWACPIVYRGPPLVVMHNSNSNFLARIIVPTRQPRAMGGVGV